MPLAVTQEDFFVFFLWVDGQSLKSFVIEAGFAFLVHLCRDLTENVLCIRPLIADI